MTDNSRGEKDLSSLNTNDYEGLGADSDFKLDIQTSLLATKKAMDEDMKVSWPVIASDGSVGCAHKAPLFDHQDTPPFHGLH